jgi:hypothetical protein
LSTKYATIYAAI